MIRGDSIRNVIVLHPEDNVAVAVRDLEAGARIDAGRSPFGSGSHVTPSVAADAGVRLHASIPAGHKLALRDMVAGQPVTKYGETIGVALRPIKAGEHVHTHNLGLGEADRTAVTDDRHEPNSGSGSAHPLPPEEVPTFQGYLRPDGRVGTRNYILVISTVNCSASVARAIATSFTADSLREYPNVDGVVALTHKSGCGMRIGGEDYRQLQRTLAGHARNPNVWGSVIVGLGCEGNQVQALMENEGLSPGEASTPLRTLLIHELGGFRRTMEAGCEAVRALLPGANACTRTVQPASNLLLGLECGGSDGNSGITANPALGAAVDLLVRCGGTAVLGETPEIYGAEHLLVRRARNKEVGERILERVRWWERYARALGAGLDGNPSPGNKAGGLTTIYEKSLGAIAKGGSTPLNAVYEFAEPIRERGLVFMDTPGFDSVSITGFVAGGANVVVFTTGRGSVYGGKPVPTLKVASNSDLYRRMPDDMDIDAGPILDGVSVEEVGRLILEEVIAVASGKRAKSEEHGIGEEEFSPWTLGPVL